MSNDRKTEHEIDSVFYERWSPRAFDGSKIPHEDLLKMLEASRWAPSAYNVQPWRFLYAEKDDENWPMFVSFLNEFNVVWAKNAAALVIVLSDTMMPPYEGAEPVASTTNSLDTGAAWVQFALQATSLGYKAHGMAGLNYDLIKEKLNVPDSFKIEMAIAVGNQTEPTILPESLQGGEQASSRKPLQEIAYAGAFKQ